MKKVYIVDMVSIFYAIVKEDGKNTRLIQGDLIVKISASHSKVFTTKKDLEAFRKRIKTFAQYKTGKKVFVTFNNLITIDDRIPDGWVAKHVLVDGGKIVILDSKGNEKTLQTKVVKDEKTKEPKKVID